MEVGGWHSQDLCIGSAEATDWKKIPEGLWLQQVMSEHGMNLKYSQKKGKSRQKQYGGDSGLVLGQRIICSYVL